MSIVLKVKVRRPIKVQLEGEKVQLFPGDDFPFDPDDRAHWTLYEHNALAFERADAPEADEAAFLDRVEAVEGIGPATISKIREAFGGH